MTRKVRAIACVNKNGAIGKDGKLLYHIKNDLTNFKRMTMNNVVIMGRKTFESLPNKKPLEDRINIVLTSNTEYHTDQYDNLYIVHSIKDCMDLCDAYFDKKNIFVIGGREIYQAFLENGLINEMLLTLVDDNSEGDTYFPSYNENEWYTYFETQPESENEVSFTFKILVKK